jgi:hypothetical protein
MGATTGLKNINLILNMNQYYTRSVLELVTNSKKAKQIDYVLEIGMKLKSRTSRTIRMASEIIKSLEPLIRKHYDYCLMEEKKGKHATMFPFYSNQ